jgi:hypothetical protein
MKSSHSGLRMLVAAAALFLFGFHGDACICGGSSRNRDPAPPPPSAAPSASSSAAH